ncbi:SDR family NAD(P)-dependent oxidoreductase [Dysosmobacter sp.]|uniref:SDR family NAD(P)-dependent oxidoreductase n=1 Tax=Dysosmobacter sp. TaxID=2591382 RepID=UPI002A861C06|nr:SDR family NAD(P)-dependent oxidoreductase [Dysosmobacter sp.]MDY3282776.1 SDR family NAD(P)-dependent oxidoreductase [Dysosmobacter sp.]
MEMNLTGKTVVITGAGTGIGKAAALEFLKEGCNVAICGRRLEKLEEAKAEFAAQGYDKVLARSVDVTDYDALAAFADEVEQTFGQINVWINNAGSNHIKSLMDYDVEEFRAMADVILVSVFSGSKIAAEHMRKIGGGVILNASSFSAVIPNAGRAPYSACKAGVSSLTRSFAAELAKDNIRVVAYVPGMTATEISAKNIAMNGPALMSSIPMQRFGTPQDLAKLIVFLASDNAGYINGTQVEVAGAKFCVQNPLYSYQN